MRTVNLKLPTKWIDLSNRQLLFVAKLFLSDFAKNRSKFLTHAFVFFSGARIINYSIIGFHRLKIKGTPSFEMEVSLVTSIANTLDWLFKDVTEIKPLKRILFAFPVNYRLHYTNFEQFLTAENYYIAYSETKQVKYLNMLIASLYSLPFQSFNSKKIKSRSKLFNLVSLQTKYTVFLWFSGFRWYMYQECPDLFKVSDDSKTQTKLIIKEHILGFIRGLTEGDVTKTNAVYKTDTWTALYELNEKAKQGNKETKK